LDLDIETMRRQHAEAEEMAASLLAIVANYRDLYDAVPIARLVGKLNALLRVHLAYEDMVLYPALMRAGDAEVAGLANAFHEDMGALAPQFEEFAWRWSGPTVIDMMFDRFREEATEILAALGARIERENDQLYPLAERIALPRAA
jgi:hemerythrin-like domain-containing protein